MKTFSLASFMHMLRALETHTNLYNHKNNHVGDQTLLLIMRQLCTILNCAGCCVIRLSNGYMVCYLVTPFIHYCIIHWGSKHHSVLY